MTTALTASGPFPQSHGALVRRYRGATMRRCEAATCSRAARSSHSQPSPYRAAFRSSSSPGPNGVKTGLVGVRQSSAIAPSRLFYFALSSFRAFAITFPCVVRAFAIPFSRGVRVFREPNWWNLAPRHDHPPRDGNAKVRKGENAKRDGDGLNRPSQSNERPQTSCSGRRLCG